MWTTADYALIVSLASAALSLFALVWNVWQKYIFVKPRLQISFALGQVFLPTRPGEPFQKGVELLTLNVTNFGPGSAILHSCVGRTRRRWVNWRYRRALGLINPIHGDPTSATPHTLGPFSGGLPAKIDEAETKSFYFPFNKQCFLRDPLIQVGAHDTFGRYFWCRRRDYKRALESWRKAFKLKPRKEWMPEKDD